MHPISVIDAPSVLGLFPRGVERAPAALHAAHLMERLGTRRRVPLVPPPFTGIRDEATGINHASPLLTFSRSLADAITAERAAGAFPLVLGGDCTNIFGALLAAAPTDGLLFIDGHADFAHPDEEPSGEAASMDLAIATGRTALRFDRVDGRQPLVADEQVAVLGFRVHDDGTDTNLGTYVGDTPITAIDLATMRDLGIRRSCERALSAAGRHGNYWVHVDVDVLDDDAMPAVDYRHPGGLSWDELTLIVSMAVRGGANGMDIAIFNPSLDADGSLARRLVAFLADAVRASLSGVTVGGRGGS